MKTTIDMAREVYGAHTEWAGAPLDRLEQLVALVREYAYNAEKLYGKKDWQAIQKHRLQVDSRKWILSKLAPKKYGEKLEVSGDPVNPLVHRIERVVVKA